MKKFFQDLKKYKNYIKYATVSDIKSDVTGSYLGWLWIVLEPLIFMLIYLFISSVVFGRTEQYLAAFIFIGLTIWKFFQRTVTSSVKLVSSNREIVTKVFVPKFVLLLIQILSNLFKLFVSFLLVGIFMIFYQVPLSLYIFYIIPIIIVLFFVTFGISLLFMHFGVFVEDLNKLVPLALKFVFYLSGIFYSITSRVPAPYNALLYKLNPVAFLITDCRSILLYSSSPNYLVMLMWFVAGVVISVIGINIIYKYENSYVKVMK